MVANLSELGIAGRCDHHDLGRAAHDVGALVDERRATGEGSIDGYGVWALLRRKGLAGECALVDLEPVRDEDPRVTGHGGAGREERHVTRDHLLDRDLDRGPLPPHGRGRPHEPEQTRYGVSGPVLLVETEPTGHRDDPEDHHSVLGVAHRE